METAVHRALEACGIQAEAHAVTYLHSNPRRIDNGNLKNSITHKVEDKTAYIGTNVEYGIYVHEGTGIYAGNGGGRKTPWSYQDDKGKWHVTRGMAPNRFLKNAVANHAEEYKMIIENELKKG